MPAYSKVTKRLVDKSQAYFWTKRWREGEREASEDVKAGRVKTFDSVEELAKSWSEAFGAPSTPPQFEQQAATVQHASAQN